LRRNCLLKHIIEGKTDGGIVWREDKEVDVNSYWMTLRKRKDTGNWNESTFQSLWRTGRIYDWQSNTGTVQCHSMSAEF
jgi:hypothetical protein